MSPRRLCLSPCCWASAATSEIVVPPSATGTLTHLATLTRNDLRYGDTEINVPTLTNPTPTQRRAFELLHTPIPLTLT
jgi:hypothetical protein